jgi:pilus assembly protein CpaF
VRLVTRTANVEGAGAIGLRDLVRQSLRMRPDRLVVGEFRGAEMVELLVALNTGHEGGAATLHANSAADVPARLAALGGLAGLSLGAVTSLASSALRVVIHLRRLREGARVIDELGLLDRAGDSLGVHPVWRRGVGVGFAAGALFDDLVAREAPAPRLLQGRTC